MNEYTTEATPQPDPKVRVKIEPVQGSRLESLLCEYNSAKESEDAAKAKAEELRQAIRSELQDGFDPENLPDAFDVPAHPRGAYPAYSLSWVAGGEVLDRATLEAAVGEETLKPFLKRRRGHWAWAVKQQGRRR
jgi:hypothetical protein